MENKYEEINGTWGILELENDNKYLVGRANSRLDNIIFITTKHNRIFIKMEGNEEIKGSFKINRNEFKDSISIYNATNPVFNREYELILDTVFENVLSTHTELLLMSKKIKIRSQRIEIKPH